MNAKDISVFLFLITVSLLLPSSECVSKQGHLSMLIDTYRICSEAKSLIPCLKLRSLLILDKLTKDDNAIPLVWNSFSLVKDPEVRTGNRMLPLTQEELVASLPEEEAARDKTLDLLLLTAVSKFVKSRTLQIKLPEVALNTIRDSFEEGRGKKGGKGDGYAMMGMMMMMGGMLMKLGFAGVAAMAGKALMVSMMALMLSAILALKKHGGGEHHGSSLEVIQVPSHGHGYHGRSLDDDAWPTTDLPYRAYSYAAPDINALQADNAKIN